MSIDLDSSYTGPLVNEWIKHLQQSMKKHVQSIDGATSLQFEAIRKSSIEAAFKIAIHLQVTSHTKYMAILLYDEFIYKHFLKVYTTEIVIGLQEKQLDKICNKIASKAKLYLLSCFQLACKMDSSSKVDISEIIKILEIIDSKTTYTYDMIISAEYEVFKTVGFRMPLNTPLTCIEVLLAVTNSKDEIDYEIAMMLLDIAFLQHEELYTQFQQEISKRVGSMKFKKSTLLKSNMLFLSASIVASTKLFHESDEAESIVKMLAEKSLSRRNDIVTMAYILLEMARK